MSNASFSINICSYVTLSNSAKHKTKQLLELQRNSASVDINPRFKKAQLTQFYLQSFISDSQTYKPDFKVMHEGA